MSELFLALIFIILPALFFVKRPRPDYVYNNIPWIAATLMTLTLPVLIPFGIIGLFKSKKEILYPIIIVALIIISIIWLVQRRKFLKNAMTLIDNIFGSIKHIKNLYSMAIWNICVFRIGYIEAKNKEIKIDELKNTINLIHSLIIGITFIFAIFFLFLDRPIYQSIGVLFVYLIIATFVSFKNMKDQIANKSGIWSSIVNTSRLDKLCVNKHACGNKIKVAHLTDLHIPKKGQKLTESHVWGENEVNAMNALANAAKDFPEIVISGDITDTGSKEAWEEFEKVFNDSKSIIIAPGNHDLNIVGYGILSLIFDADSSNYSGRKKRIKNYMKTAIKIMGDKAYVLKKGEEGKKDKCVNFKDEAFKFAGETDFNLDDAYKLFPIWVKSEQDSNLFFIIWNTTRPSALTIFNSVGHIDTRQLENFQSMQKLNNNNNNAIIHVMHHKLGFPFEKLNIKENLNNHKRLVQLAGMILTNAAEVINILSTDKSSIVLHGHHHASYQGQKGNLKVISSSSSTLGTEMWSDDKEPKSPGFLCLKMTVYNDQVYLNEFPSWRHVNSK